MLTVYTDWLRAQIRELIKDEEGASAVEYGLIVGLIAVAIIVAVSLVGNGLGGLFNKVEGQLTNAG